MSLKRLASGKVREIYELDHDHLVIVTSDRVSAFDVIMAEPIPDKGRVLTAITTFWLDELAHVAPNHLVSLGVPPEAGDQEKLAGRTMVVRRAEMLPIECIVRGYLSGSAWAEYRRSGTMHGDPLPAGLSQSDKLPEPVFTPSTKATEGHDENISYEAAVNLVGAELAAEARRISLEAYAKASALAAERGIIIADTKFELGVIYGKLAICDEVLTPDSSRFWPAEQWQPGTTPPSFDKQPLRDWLEDTGWDKSPPPPALPADVVDSVRTRYVAAYEQLTGDRFSEWPGAGGRGDGVSEFTVLVEVRLREGIADPQGATIERALPALGFDDVTGMATGKAFRFSIEADSAGAARTRSEELCRRFLTNPVIEDGLITVSEPDPAPPSERTGAPVITVGVVLFPGSNCEHDVVAAVDSLGGHGRLVWHGDTGLGDVDAVILPGGFAHGDYLRPGAIARFSPIMAAIEAFAASGGPVVGICNGFQVLTEAHLLPGALGRNAGLAFLCAPAELVVASDRSVLSAGVPVGTGLRIPINHFEGNFLCDPRTLDELRADGRIVLRYVDNPNGSVDDIAGITNAAGNVVGLMPHPERACDPLVGGTDGRVLLGALLRSAGAGVAA